MTPVSSNCWTGWTEEALTHTIAQRVARHLERQGFLVRDAENGYLTCDRVDADPDSPMNQLLGSSITYRIAVGPQQGRKVFTLQTLPVFMVYSHLTASIVCKFPTFTNGGFGSEAAIAHSQF